MHLTHREHPDVWIPMQCNQPDCLYCWRLRMWRNRKSISKQISNWRYDRIWLLTRSLRNLPSLEDAWTELQNVIRRWNKRSQRDPEHPWATEVRDWVSVFEIKAGLGGWNVHEHCLVWGFGKRLDYASWQRNWKEAAHDPAAHLDLRQVGPEAAHYVTHYMAKGLWGGLSQKDATRHRDFLRGKRQLRRKRGSAPKDDPKGFERCCYDHSDDPTCAWIVCFGDPSAEVFGPVQPCTSPAEVSGN